LTSSEAPNRKAAFYREVGPARNGLVGATQLHGPELTFEPLRDAAAAWEKCLESGEPTVVGGVLAVPRPVDEAAAVELGGRALEVLVALSFEEKALEILQRQENLILLSLEHATALQDPGWDFVRVGNGFLVWVGSPARECRPGS
jgi:phosphoribosylaminoimidazolecarboxamide formyltransferase/IMP cyclohydrolase